MATFTKLAGAGLAALLFTTPAMAQMAWEDEGWDTDGDGVFSLEEFREGFRERINFAEWDADGDGLLTEEEFGGGVYDRYDADASGAFEEPEYGVLREDFGTEGVWRYQGEELVADPGEGLEGEEVTNVETVDSEGLADEDIGDADGGIGEGLAADENLVEDEVGLGDEMAGIEGWDIDGDGVLLRNEFQDGFREWGTFGEFDVNADGGITEDELTEGIFTGYDDDGTGFIEEPELTDIGDDMGDEGFWDV